MPAIDTTTLDIRPRMANPRAFVRDIQRRVDSAAVQLLRRTRFVPGERHGVPVPPLTTQPLRNVFPKE